MFESEDDQTSESHLGNLVKKAVDWVDLKGGPDAGASFSHANEGRGNKLVLGVVSWHAL